VSRDDGLRRRSAETKDALACQERYSGCLGAGGILQSVIAFTLKRVLWPLRGKRCGTLT
jgi:hypothetical protein